MYSSTRGSILPFFLFLVAIGVLVGAYYLDKEYSLSNLSWDATSTYDPSRDNAYSGFATTPTTPGSSGTGTSGTGATPRPTTPRPTTPRPTTPSTPKPSTTTYFALTTAYATQLVQRDWGGCDVNACTSLQVSIAPSGSQYIVTAIYDGLQDDSVRATKQVAAATFVSGAWTLGEPSFTVSCQPGRGHTDFSGVLCN